MIAWSIIEREAKLAYPKLDLIGKAILIYRFHRIFPNDWQARCQSLIGDHIHTIAEAYKGRKAIINQFHWGEPQWKYNLAAVSVYNPLRELLEDSVDQLLYPQLISLEAATHDVLRIPGDMRQRIILHQLVVGVATALVQLSTEEITVCPNSLSPLRGINVLEQQEQMKDKRLYDTTIAPLDTKQAISYEMLSNLFFTSRVTLRKTAGGITQSFLPQQD